MNELFHSQQEFLERLYSTLEANLENEHFGVSELARVLGMSRTSLHRKINSTFNISTGQFIREYRLKQGMELLLTKSYSISEVSYKVGFSSSSYFTRCFHEYFGYPPSEVHQHKNTQKISKKPFRIFKPIDIDKSDLVVWLLVFLVVSNIIAINYNQIIRIFKKQEIRIALTPFVDNSPDEKHSKLLVIRQEIISSLREIEGLQVVNIPNYNSYLESTQNVIEDIKNDYQLTHLLRGEGSSENDETQISLILSDLKSDKDILHKEFTCASNQDPQEFANDMAFVIADFLNLQLTKTEEDNINKKKTENAMAFNNFSWGLNALNEGNLVGAKEFFLYSTGLDSTYAEPYVWLAHIYLNILAPTFDQNPNKARLLRDTAEMYVDLAIHFDPDYYWPYRMRAEIYKYRGMTEKYHDIMMEYEILKEKAGVIDGELPAQNYWDYAGKWELCMAIQSYYRYLSSEKKDTAKHEYLNLTNNFIYCLNETGFPDISFKYINKIWEIGKAGNNSRADKKYRERLLFKDYYKGDYRKVMENAEKWMNKFGTTESTLPVWKMNMAVLVNDIAKAKEYLPGYLSFRKMLTDSTMYEFFTGIYFYKTGDIERANLYLNREILKFKESLRSNQSREQRKIMNAIWLAGIYAIKGENNNCIEYLNYISEKNKFDKEHLNYLNSYFFDSVKDEPEFISIYGHVDTTFNKMHECVRKILEENGEILQVSVR